MSRSSSDVSKQHRDSIQTQLNRLLTQLQDLEELRADLEEDEYEQLRGETLDQLKEFEESLARSLRASDAHDPFLDDVERARCAVQENIRSAVASSGAKERFAKKESAALWARLASLQDSMRLGALTPEVFAAERRSVLAALQALGEPLNDSDREYITGRNSMPSQFTATSDHIDISVVRK